MPILRVVTCISLNFNVLKPYNHRVFPTFAPSNQLLNQKVMKKQFITRVFLSSLVLVLTSLFGGGNLLAQTPDVLTATNLEAPKSYGTFTPYTGESGVVYEGACMLHQNKNALQLNYKNKNVGIVTTTSNCFATKIVVTWGQNNKNNRQLSCNSRW